MARSAQGLPALEKQVYNTFARWRKRGVWDALLLALRQQVRTKGGKPATPSGHH